MSAFLDSMNGDSDFRMFGRAEPHGFHLEIDNIWRESSVLKSSKCSKISLGFQTSISVSYVKKDFTAQRRELKHLPVHLKRTIP